jgi:hypothetical protein
LFQETFVDWHLDGSGHRTDAGQIRVDGVLLDLTYGVTDTTTISVTLPYLAGKYVGSKPHPGSPIDDGKYHGGVQDLRVELRRSLLSGPLAITPFVGTILPSHDYIFYGHGSIGRDLREVQVGASVARLLDPIVPGAFVQGRYTYGFTERLFGISHNRSLVNIELGYFMNPRVRAFALTSAQIGHGGVDLYLPFPYGLPAEQVIHHDRISRTNQLDVGGGAQFSASESVDLFGSIIHTLSGANTHALTYGLNLGLTWSFHAGPSTRSAAERSLFKCICEKN